jgi:hypothetical protein
MLRCLGVRRPAVSDRARPLEEVIAVGRTRFSALRSSASRDAFIYLSGNGTVAAFERRLKIRIPRRWCRPEGERPAS